MVPERQGRYSNKEWASLSEEQRQAVRDAARMRREAKDEEEESKQPVLSVEQELRSNRQARLRRVKER